MIKSAVHQTSALAVSFLLTASVALAQDSSATVPKQNGMLCGYMIFLSLYGTGKACFADEDRELLEVLDEVVVDFDAFILRNPDPRIKPEDLRNLPDGLAKFKTRHMESWRRSDPADTGEKDMCSNRENSAIKSYLKWRRKVNVQEIRDNVKEHLSVDRVPTMNPCL